MDWMGTMNGLGKLNGVGMCSRGYGGFGNMAGLGVLWFMFGYSVYEYVLLDWSDVFSGPVIPFALGCNVRASWGGVHVSYGAGDVCGLVCWE